MLDWLDHRTAWQFLGILYVLRWVALAPVILLEQLIFTQTELSGARINTGGMDLLVLLPLWVVLDPVFETLLECTLPYWVVSRVRNYRLNRPKRCWGYVAIAALAMAVMHPIAAVLPSLVTGAFLGYCYAHFAATSAWKAILTTAVFHGAINIVGWTLIVIS